MIGLVSLLHVSGIVFDPTDTKIHLACWNGIEHPIDVYYAGRWENWQDDQNRRNFECSHVISLIDLGQSLWLFVGVYSVHGSRPNPHREGCVIYKTQLLPGQEELIARVVVSHKRSRASYVWSTPDVPLSITEIRRDKMTIAEFPGYNEVLLSHAKLQTIVRQKIASWHGALANIKGIYLIVDTSTGKPYVGKASGKEGIWNRWCAYAKGGHGGNVELRKLMKEQGPDHMRNFQYSILEIADNHASDEDILLRESHWMNVLLTRKFGLN
jgi:hypothetical protein